jgi:hypothetical protein
MTLTPPLTVNLAAGKKSVASVKCRRRKRRKVALVK